MRKVLFIHQNFPGQFKHIATHLERHPDYHVISIGNATAPGLPGIKTIRYKLTRTVSKETHPYCRSYESAVLYGQAVLRVLLRMKEQGYKPDTIIAHPGWGETLFVKDVYPDTRLIHYCEYYYHSKGADAGFDPEFDFNIDNAAALRARNALHLLNLENCDIGITPTRWQHSLHPDVYKAKVEVIHEGVDLNGFTLGGDSDFRLQDGRLLRKGQGIVTYVARNLEPYRGIHVFLRSIELLLKANRECEVLIVGGDEVSYGRRPKGGGGWCEYILRSCNLDMNRVHFLGKLSYESYKKVLRVSDAHVYLTYPFVLSWSLLEAMASGCLIIASKTAPVEEVIVHNKNGVLVDFFDTEKICTTINRFLLDLDAGKALRDAARRDSRKFSMDLGLEAIMRLL